MKNKLFTTFLVAFALSMCFANRSEAQQAKISKPIYNNTVSVNPVALAFEYLQVTYEHRLTSRKENSITAYFSWANYGGYNGLDLGGSYRWYVKSLSKYRPLEGFSFGPTATVGYWSPASDASQSDPSGVAIALGAEAAYKVVFQKGITFEPYVAARFNVLHPKDKFEYKPLCIGVNLGYSFRTSTK